MTDEAGQDLQEETPEANEQTADEEQTPTDETAGNEEQAQAGAADEEPGDDLPEFAIRTEDAGVLRKRVVIGIPRARIDGKFEENYGELARTAQVPGFRIGRAPRRLIEKRFGREVVQDVRNNLVAEAYKEAVDGQSLKILGEPEIDLDAIEVPDAGDLEFSFEVEVEPEFDLPALDAIPIKRPKIEIGDEDVTRQIDQLRARLATLEPVEEGATQSGDQVIADLRIEVDGQTFAETENAEIWVRSQVIQGIRISELGEALTDKEPGQQVEIEAEVPEDHEKTEFRGQKAKVTISIHEIKRIVLPELDAGFLDSIGAESEQEMRESIRVELEGNLAGRIRSAMKEQVSAYLLANTSLELPEQMTVRSSERALARQMVQLQQMGIPSEEIEKRRDELLTSAQERSVSELKLYFIMLKIVEQMEIQTTEDEIRGRVAAIASHYGKRPERMYHQMLEEGQLAQIALAICEDKVMEKLLLDAKIEESDLSQQPDEAGGDEAGTDAEDADEDAT